MARIKKVTKVFRAANMNNEESTDKKLERSVVDMNSLNSRKLCTNDRNRRILLNLKSYPNLFFTNNFCNNIFPVVRKYSSSASTQTSCNESFPDERKSMSTQTSFWAPENEAKEGKRVKLLGYSKSDCCLLQNHKLNPENRTSQEQSISDFGIIKSPEQHKDNEKRTNVIILHKNENIKNPKTSPLKKKMKIKKIKNQRRNKFFTRVYTNKKGKRQFHSYKVNRNLRITEEFQDENACIFHNQFVKKLGIYSVTAVAKYSSKLVRLFSDLGLNIAESLINLYKLYESQKCQSLNTMCSCQQINPKIDQLASKLGQLEDSLHISQGQIREQQKCIDQTVELTKKLEEIKQKLEAYDLMKSELAALKKRLNESGEMPQSIKIPPPPPPPPLPIFSLTTNCASKTFLKVVENERKLINCESSRPIITLEDILNVKLKKISVTNI